MLQHGNGAVINISSFSAAEPSQSFPTSSVFRAGLAAYTKLFADKYAASNIRMNNVLPGFINSLPEKPGIKEQIPMGRYGTVEEVAALVSHLASDTPRTLPVKTFVSWWHYPARPEAVAGCECSGAVSRAV